MIRALLCVALVVAGCKKAEETKAVPAVSLSRGPGVKKLSEAQLKRIDRCHQVLAEVDSTPIPKRVGDFSLAENPDHEIAIWEQIAAAYDGFVKKRARSADARHEAYSLLVLRSTKSEPEVMAKPLTYLSREDAADVLRRYVAVPP